MLLSTVGPAPAAPEQQKRTISVTGIGSVKAAPDIAYISTGVITEAPTAQKAAADNASAMGRVIGELKAQGLEPRDIQTTNYSVRPRYQHFKDKRPPAITGYRVVNTVRIAVRELNKLGAVLDKVVTLGSNQIGGVQFGLSAPGKIKDEARRMAMADALRKAKLLAGVANATVGKAQKIEEHAAVARRPAFGRAALQVNPAAVPIEPSAHVVHAQVNVVWELQ